MKRISLFALVMFSFLLVGVALAQGGSYDLARWTVASGGGASAGGGYALAGTSGQPATAALAQGEFVLGGGFWGQTPTKASRVYLPYIVHTCQTPDCGLPPNPADVAPPLDPTVATDINTATAFLYTGENPIQTGVAPGTIAITRTAVLRGRVLTREGASLPGVAITVLNHPELGRTRSRADGMFDMVVNGGGVLTLTYEKEGYLPAQRQLNTPWQDYLWAPDMALIPVDPQVTTINLTQPAIQVAQGSVVTDEDGTRQATLLFPPGVQAVMTLASGGVTAQAALSTLNVRATEYTVGENGPRAMPAELPPNVGYTYAVEFSADEALAAGAQDVVFDQPVISYVDNFLGFPAGTTVPVGYYDQAKAAWVSSESGVVLKIVAISGGLAGLDVTGDDLADPPATLAKWGIGDAERGRLAGLYPSGKSLWRYRVLHFSAWDANWGTRCVDDICDPPDTPDPVPDDPDDTCESQGSIIACQSQALGEEVSVTGTPFMLHYESSRTPGYRHARTLDVVLTKGSLPRNIIRVELAISVAGKVRIERSFDPTPDLTFRFTWDGTDAYGRRTQGGQPYRVYIGYTYRMEYVATDRFGYNGGGMSVTLTGNYAREEMTLWQVHRGIFRTWDARGLGLGGWTLDVNHAYDPEARVFYGGDGSRRSNLGAVIETVAGGGDSQYGENIPATQARLSSVSDIAVANDGSVYVVDGGWGEVRRVSPDGRIRTVAGGGYVWPADGLPATSVSLNNLAGIALAPDGSFYISEPTNHRVYWVGPDGILHFFAGGGNPPDGLGDGLPATQARLTGPTGLDLAPDGSLYIADTSDNVVRRVGPDGLIYTAAGTGQFGCDGDGGLAVQARLGNQWDVKVAPDGGFYLLDRSFNRIRHVDTSGIITTTIGAAGWGYRGDGGPAYEALMNSPYKISLAKDGRLYIADQGNRRVRVVGIDGIITTVAGNGSGNFTGDGGLAVAAGLEYPSAIAVGPDGTLYIGNTGGQAGRVRRVYATLPGFEIEDIIVPSEEGGELYHLDARGRHLSTLNALTGATTSSFTYDNAGQLISIIDGDGNVTRIERDGNGVPAAIVAPFGQRTMLTLDGNGYLASIANPAGETYRFSYTPDGLLSTLTDPRGSASTYRYDDLGLLVKAEDPAGGSKTLSRQKLLADGTRRGGWEVSLTTAMGRTTRYRVETLNKKETLLTNTFPDGLSNTVMNGIDGSTTITYTDGAVVRKDTGPDPRWGMLAPVTSQTMIETPGGLAAIAEMMRTATLTNPANLLSLEAFTDTLLLNSRSYTTTFASAGWMLTDTTPAGRQAFVSIDAQGQPVLEQVAGLDPLRYTYDARGRLSGIVQGSGVSSRTTTLNYNTDGYLSAIVDPLGRTASFVYDPAGRVTYQTLPGNRVISYTYDANDNLTSLTPPGEPPHVFTYTAVNLTGAYIPPDVGTGSTRTGYTYNVDRQLTRITRPDGQVVDLNYDTAGRLIDLTTPDHQTTYAYDPATGNLKTIANSRGVNLSYAYDGALITRTAWTGVMTGTVDRAYDNDLHIVALTVTGSSGVSFQYDADSLLTRAGDLVLDRNAQNGLLTSTALGSVTDTWSYNTFGEPTTYSAFYSSTNLLSFQYIRDKLGRITQKTETIGGATDVYSYTYDLAGRLSGVQKNSVTVATYTYDSNGNRLSFTGPGGTVTGSYDAQDRLLQYGSTTYTYTGNGELLTKTTAGQTTTYQYDALGNLLAVTLPDGTQIDYVIDGANRRVGKKVNGVLAQAFLYEDTLRPIAELDEAGNIVSRFVYGTRVNVPEYIMKGGNTYRFILDHLGSPRLVVDVATGQIAQRMDYDEFGNVVNDTNLGFQPFGFAGGMYDQDTRFVKFGARDYDAITGRWTAKDPMLFGRLTFNLFTYVNGDVINRIDPTGLYFRWVDPELMSVFDLVNQSYMGQQWLMNIEKLPTPVDLIALGQIGYTPTGKKVRGEMEPSGCGDDVPITVYIYLGTARQSANAGENPYDVLIGSALVHELIHVWQWVGSEEYRRDVVMNYSYEDRWEQLVYGQEKEFLRELGY